MEAKSAKSVDRGRFGSALAPEASSSGLRFSCPHCRMLLHVTPGMAGVSGPCPGCQKEIQAPANCPPRSIEIKPRPFKPRKEAAPPAAGQAGSEVFAVPAMGSPPPPDGAEMAVRPAISRPLPSSPQPARAWPGAVAPAGTPSPEGTIPATRVSRPRRGDSGRAVSPFTGMSQGYHDRREVVAIIKVLVAAALTLAIALAVMLVVKKRFAEPTYELRPEAPASP